MNLARLLLAVAFFALPQAFAAPADHLATIPEASVEEKEVISLLQQGKTVIDSGGTIIIPFYNPTKYVMNSCTIRVFVPGQKIDRVYHSENTSVPPLIDGAFKIQTALIGLHNEDIKCEVLKVKYTVPKK